MPYNSTTGIVSVDTSTSPYTGVSINDIQQALDCTRNDIGGLITDGLINKWAKYKPVKMSGLDFASQRNSNFTWKSTATWWKGYNGQCGMTFQTFTSFGNPATSSSFFYKLLDGQLAWGYEKPTGGINQYPFRFFDFLQYSRFALKPVTGVYDNLRISSNGTLTVQLDETRAQESLGLPSVVGMSVSLYGILTIRESTLLRSRRTHLGQTEASTLILQICHSSGARM